jgi:hypothetical protein
VTPSVLSLFLWSAEHRDQLRASILAVARLLYLVVRGPAQSQRPSNIRVVRFTGRPLQLAKQNVVRLERPAGPVQLVREIEERVIHMRREQGSEHLGSRRVEGQDQDRPTFCQRAPRGGREWL